MSSTSRAPWPGRRPTGPSRHDESSPAPSARGALRPAEVLAAGAVCVGAAALLAVLGTRLSFFNDDWRFLFQRPGLESHGGLDVLLAGAPPPRSSCRRILLAHPGFIPVLTLTSGRMFVRQSTRVLVLALGRFAPAHPRPVSFLAAGETEAVRLPRDAAEAPWVPSARSPQAARAQVTVCTV